MKYEGYYPSVKVELNLTRNFRIGVGVSYNLYTMMDESMHGYRNCDISAPAGFFSSI